MSLLAVALSAEASRVYPPSLKDGHVMRWYDRLVAATSGWRVATRSRKALRPYRNELRRGPFLHAGGVTWRHWSTPIPGHVRRTKARDSRWRYEGQGALALATRILRRLAVVTLAGTLWGGGSRRSGYPIGIATWEGGCVLLDPARGRVARQLPTKHVTPEQFELRDRWAKHVPTPNYRVERGGAWIIEGHVTGDHLSVLPGHEQIEVARAFLRSYARLVEEEAEEPQAGVAHHLASRDVLAALPVELRRRLDGLALLQGVDRWPWVPTTCDHSLKNVLVAAPGRIVFIDVMPLIRRPFFNLPVALLTLWGASLPAVRRAHLGGDLDVEFRDIFAAARFPYDGTLEGRQGLVALSTALLAVFASRRGACIDTDAVSLHANALLRSQGLRTPEDWRG